VVGLQGHSFITLSLRALIQVQILLALLLGERPRQARMSDVHLGLGSLFPIDIPGRFTNDGGTLLRLWRERNH